MTITKQDVFFLILIFTACIWVLPLVGIGMLLNYIVGLHPNNFYMYSIFWAGGVGFVGGIWFNKSAS